jgi:hypothetical protein
MLPCGLRQGNLLEGDMMRRRRLHAACSDIRVWGRVWAGCGQGGEQMQLTVSCTLALDIASGCKHNGCVTQWQWQLDGTLWHKIRQ